MSMVTGTWGAGGARLTDWDPSATLVATLQPTHSPDRRDMVYPWRPSSTTSAGSAG